MKSKKQMKQNYKRDIWKRGGKVPKDYKDDSDPMQISKLDSRLRIVRGKKKGPV